MECAPCVPDLVRQLRGFHGYRTLWLDGGGRVVHAEPEFELEDEGYRYIATLMRPGPEQLAEALGRAGVRTAPAQAGLASATWAPATEAAPAPL